MPQRRSMAWKRQPWAAAKSRGRGKTRSFRALRSAFRSLKVELTKIRKVREGYTATSSANHYTIICKRYRQHSVSFFPPPALWINHHGCDKPFTYEPAIVWIKGTTTTTKTVITNGMK